jgi:uncharacterized protein with ParB-like and HNH nuclease domain
MHEANTVKSLITPHDQTLREVFETSRSYFIDIYQREYKWTADNVKTLLNDIEIRFTQYDRRKANPSEIREDVLQRFEPYFLNTYLTSTTATSTSVVDGQQRLTTFLLILIKFYHILVEVEKSASAKGKTFSSETIKKLIFETDDFGEAERFKIFNENREAAFRGLIEKASLEKIDQTTTRIATNFATISEYFETLLRSGDNGAYDLAKTTYYLTYLLDRISIVEIRIERQENVAMIFEVVNDRGVGLKPYEILKGKLIGNLSPTQKEKANTVWTELQDKYFRATLKNATEKALDLDSFFQTFFRAKFADSENEYERFEGDYHYEMYRNPRVREYFKDYRDRDLLFTRITNEICYFANLYLDLRTSYRYEAAIFNKLLDQNQQYLLILSSVTWNDPERERKVLGIPEKFDQFHTVLRLLDAYDSNSFQRLIYPLNKDVRDKPLSEVRSTFESGLISTLVQQNVLKENQCSAAADIFEFERFKGVHNRWTNFSKYVLMRIDRYLAQSLDKPSYASEHLEELEDRFNKNNLKRYGMHLEHVYTQHAANQAVFTNAAGVFDEARFQQTRNLMGMVLLLKDKQNLSSNNEVYEDKVTTYSQSNLIWNEMLVGHMPDVDLRKLPPELRAEPVLPVDRVFPIEKVEARQKVVYEAIRTIWANV